ncbi:hypothetical protein FFLO_03238 [Filobasidium floriforme]|uniref:Prolactin regulatory element-binding protein n=1 Tax=Filobasidium floriforme TaxID=5210 RepID=A0A8K0JLP9_9TREE|nr:hypothetical protein FFLO_03238 [Filobasidium floriforme]
MTRTKHRAHPTPSFPVSCLGFTDDTTLLLGGGGGPSRTGIKNKLKICTASLDGRTLSEVAEHVFEPGEDLPTSMAINVETKQVVVGVNAPETTIKASSPGQGNDHCRVFSYADNKLEMVKSTQTITAPWNDDYPYQKFTAFSPRLDLLAVGTTDIDGTQSTVTLITYPGMDFVWKWESTDSKIDGELVDIDFGADGLTLAITTTTTINVFDVTSASNVSKEGIERTASIPLPTLGADPVTFRSAKFNRQPSPTPTIHAIINTNPKPLPRGKGKRPTVLKKGYCVNFSLAEATGDEKAKTLKGKWEMTGKREVGNVPVSAFEISADGMVLAYAAADYSIGLLDARTLAPLLKILHAHSFAITALAFNPSGNLLASAGADNTVRLIVIPASFGSSTMMIAAVLIALILALTAYFLQAR